jgi:hypothetical protein
MLRLSVLLGLLALASASYYKPPATQNYACCLPAGGCIAEYESECVVNRHGVYLGKLNSTGSNGCAALQQNCPGACCAPDTCRWVAERDCCNGVFRGAGSSCAANCTGACCYDEGACEEVTQSSCAGHWQALGTKCRASDGKCPSPDSVEIWLLVAVLLGTLFAFLFCAIYLCKRKIS